MSMKLIIPIHVLVISPYEFRQTLNEALVKENIVGLYDFTLTISSCDSVEELGGFQHYSEETQKKFTFDYVIIVVDSMLINALEKAEKALSLIPNYYISTRRLFFISSDTLNLDGFCKLHTKYKCPAVVGDILDPKGCKSICRRVLKLIEFCGGMKTGLPFIGIE